MLSFFVPFLALTPSNIGTYTVQREATTIAFITGNVPFRDSSSFKILIVVLVHSGNWGPTRPLARMALVV